MGSPRVLASKFQPCFVAIDSLSGELGVLVEFFYGYPDEAEPASFVHAADFLERFRVVGTRTDRPHFIRLNLNLCRVLRLANSVGWWGRVFDLRRADR